MVLSRERGAGVGFVPIGFAGVGGWLFLASSGVGWDVAELVESRPGFGDVAAPGFTVGAGSADGFGSEAGFAGGFRLESLTGSPVGSAERSGLGLPGAFDLEPGSAAGFAPVFGSGLMVRFGPGDGVRFGLLAGSGREAGLGLVAGSGCVVRLGLVAGFGLLWALGLAVRFGTGVGLGLVVGSGPGAGLETGFAAGFGSVLEPGLVVGLPVVGLVTEVRTELGSVAAFGPSTVVFGAGLGVESMPLTMVDVGGGTGLVCWAVAGSGLVLVELGLVFGVRTESGDELVSGPC